MRRLRIGPRVDDVVLVMPIEWSKPSRSLRYPLVNARFVAVDLPELLRSQAGSPIAPTTVGRLRQAFTPQEFTELCTDGRHLTLDGAVSVARAQLLQIANASR